MKGDVDGVLKGSADLCLAVLFPTFFDFQFFHAVVMEGCVTQQVALQSNPLGL